MSHNPSRAERSEYKKNGRSSSFNQQRHFSGGASTKGGGGGSARSNRSFKKKNSNAQQGWQLSQGYFSSLNFSHQNTTVRPDFPTKPVSLPILTNSLVYEGG